MGGARVTITQQGHGRRQPSARPDSAQVADARVTLKLRALAYAETRSGSDAGPELGAHAAAALCVAAIQYYALLVRDRSMMDTLRRAWEDDIRSRASTGAHADLRLCAVAYALSRHGRDSHSEFIRAAIRGLAESAVRYCQSLLGRDSHVDADVVVDDLLALDDGR